MFLARNIFLFFFCILANVDGKPQNYGTFENCKTFENDGFRCVDQSECATSKCIDIRSNGSNAGHEGTACSTEEIDRVEYLGLDCGAIVKAGNEPSVCCHNSSIRSFIPEEPPVGNCFLFASDGYKCVPENQCRTSKCVKDLRNVDDGERGKRQIDECAKEKDHINYFQFDCGFAPKSSIEANVCCHINSTIGNTDGQKTSDAPSTPNCGAHYNKGYLPRIIGVSSDTDYGEWPHTCALFKDGNFIGGASLIAPGVVLTAAHIVDDLEVKSVTVRCGDWDIKGIINEELNKHQELPLKYIITHPRFQSDILTYDISILYTDDEFELIDTITPVCLPKSQDLFEIDKETCFATGWGESPLEAQNAEAGSQKMKQVALPLVDKEKCELSLAYKDGRPYQLHESMICAGGQKNEDTCKGDGGGPLVCRRPTKDGEVFVQVGITSWGRDCGQEKVPGVYASIPNNLCFIDTITRCVHNDKYNNYFNYKEVCKDWLNEESEKIEAWLDEAMKKVGEITERSLTKKLAEKSLEKAKKSQEFLERIHSEICSRR